MSELKTKTQSVDKIELMKEYMISGDFYSAIAEIKDILKQDIPKEIQTSLIFFLGIMLKEIGNKQEALKCFDKIIEEEQNTQGYIYKAEIQTELGNYAQAWDTLRIAPKDKFASEIFKKYTSIIALELNKPEIPLKLLTENKKLIAEDPFIHKLYVLSLMKTGRYEDAQKEIVNILQKAKDKTESMLLLSWASIFTEHEEDVFNMISRMMKTVDTTSEVDFATGSLSYMLNNSGKAQELFRNDSQKIKITDKLSEHVTMQIMASAMRILALDKEDMSEEYNHLLKENEALKKKKDDTEIKVEAILNMMTKKNPFLGEKCRKIGDTAGFIVKYNPDLTEQERKDIKLAGYLCNTGMLFAADEIFTKRDILTSEEKNVLKEHPVISANVIKPFGFSESIVEMIRHHHEKVDGTGFPSKLKEDKIPYGSKVLAVAEFFVEVTNDSPRQPAISVQEAIKTSLRLSGLHFSREVCMLLKHAYSL